VMGLDREGRPVEMKPRSTTGASCAKCGGRLYIEERDGQRVVRCGQCSETRPLATLEDALRETDGLTGAGAVCDECGSPMALRRSKKGLFLGCSRYPDCKGTRPLASKEMPPAVPTQERCDKCGEAMVLRWGRFGRFLACSRFPRCRNTWQLPASMPSCPQPGCDGHIVRKTTAQENALYGCTRFPACGYTAAEPPAKERSA